MTKVITYGTFDLFHEGHYNLLKQAKELGDYLIVGVTSENFDRNRGKFNVQNSLMERIKNVEATGLADEIIIEEYIGQKIDDIQRLNVDIFTVGSDWEGYFDYLGDYCQVIYSKRTDGISSTKIRNQNSIKLGICGDENILSRFLDEIQYVNGIDIQGITNISDEKYNDYSFIRRASNLEILSNVCDVIYVNSPLGQRYELIKSIISNQCCVISEFPFSDDIEKCKELLLLAKQNDVVILEGLKTAYSPAFIKLVSLVKSGVIGEILSVDANFTQVLGEKVLDQIRLAGGSLVSLGSYPILVIGKILGHSYKKLQFVSKFENGYDIFTKINFIYDNAVASSQVAINAKSEGDLTITGTKASIYVPAPWWKTEYFEVRYEDINKNRKYFYKFEGEGLRYELVEMVKLIREKNRTNIFLTSEDMFFESEVLNKFKKQEELIII